MSGAIANKSPYLRSYRKFPQDQQTLVTEITRGWIETANAVNDRIIGIYANQPTVTGKQYFYNGEKFQSIQQSFPFDDLHLTIPHNIKSFYTVAMQYGWFTDGPVWYPLPYVDPTANKQVGIRTDVTNIYIVKGGAAPAISSGFVTLEWLSNV